MSILVPSLLACFTPGTQFVAGGAALATATEWLLGCPWFCSPVKAGRGGGAAALISLHISLLKSCVASPVVRGDPTGGSCWWISLLPSCLLEVS